MKKVTSFGIILSLVLLFSCSEETTHSRTHFPDIRVESYLFTDGGGYVFSPQTPLGIEIDDFDEETVYAYDNIVFQGYATAKRSNLPDSKIKKDIQNYLYDNSPEIIENVEAHFVDEKISSIKIFSDKNFNSIIAGESLNKFFTITTRLIVYDKKKNLYTLADGDIAQQKSFDNSFVPYGISIKLNAAPQKPDKYNFFVELITDKGKYSTPIATATIK